MKKNVFCALLISALCISMFAGCSGTPGESGNSAASGSATTTTAASGEEFNATPDNGVDTAYPDKEVGFQLEKPAAGEKIAILHTSMGDISLRFFPEAAPKAVQNFLTHAENGYFDGLTFHRVIDNFMIQGGDPKGDGTGGESIWGEAFEDEFDQKLLNLRGSISMANSGVNTNGSQFFINQAPADKFPGKASFESQLNQVLSQYETVYDQYVQYYGQSFQSVYPTAGDFRDAKITTYPALVPDAVWDLYTQNGGNINLDGAFRKSGGHTVFGQVFEGMDVVDAIAAVETDDNDKPVTAVTIDSITVTTYAG